MSSPSILTLMNNISRNIQHVFEEIVKLLIRKNITPTLNPPNGRRELVYNNYLKRYERAVIGTSYNDSVDIYNYFMTYESIGWNNDVFANFKLIPKFNRNAFNVIQQKQKKGKIPFTCQEQTHCERQENNNPIQVHQYMGRKRRSCTVNTYKSVIDIIVNRKRTLGYSSDILYPFTFKNLENIGRDIIVQTDTSISNFDSSRMSTATLRNKLQTLEQNLKDFSLGNSELYNSYIKMVRIINSVNRNKITRLLNLVALLSVQKWKDVPIQQQHIYIQFFGEKFINDLVDNDLFNILVSSPSFELVLTTSYLYPLLKMLFSVFGYSKIIPNFAFNELNSFTKNIPTTNINTIINRTLPNSLFNELSVNPTTGIVSRNTIDNVYQSNSNLPIIMTNISVHDYIRIFGGLYPTIISLMGGTEIFPSEFLRVACDAIPQNYCDLNNIPEYLWRFNDYSYCIYKNYIDSKQLVMSLCAKKNNRVKYLYTI